MTTENLTVKEAQMFQQVFGREENRTPAQKFVYERLRAASYIDQPVFQPQITLGANGDGKPVPVASHYDPIAAALTDSMRRQFIFIRDRVEARYTNETDA